METASWHGGNNLNAPGGLVMELLPTVDEVGIRQWFELLIELIRWLLRILRDLMKPTVLG